MLLDTYIGSSQTKSGLDYEILLHQIDGREIPFVHFGSSSEIGFSLEKFSVKRAEKAYHSLNRL